MRNDANGRLDRLRSWFLVLIAALVFGSISLSGAVLWWNERQIDEAQFEITCTSAHSNIQQLQALRRISRDLGLPSDLEIPPLPEGCT